MKIKETFMDYFMITIGTIIVAVSVYFLLFLRYASSGGLDIVATLYDAYGAYTGIKHTEINMIVDKHEYIQLINHVNKIDPDAFVTVYAINEMMYKLKPIVERPVK